MSTAVQEDESVTTTMGLPSFSGPVNIPVTLVQDSPDRFHLNIPLDRLYVSLVKDYDDTITWTLQVPPTLNAYFDTPAISFDGQDTGATLIDKQPLQVQLRWTNVSTERRGRSFYYTLHVVVNIDGLLIPVNLDPTVHNDPPT